ncbi:hypothetical protein Ae201684P_010940 [Aphanomyces euteiches]|nr:hypothetical protein Ae201684P_010940 [Aphanomyces euteiches]
MRIEAYGIEKSPRNALKGGPLEVQSRPPLKLGGSTSYESALLSTLRYKLQVWTSPRTQRRPNLTATRKRMHSKKYRSNKVHIEFNNTIAS